MNECLLFFLRTGSGKHCAESLAAMAFDKSIRVSQIAAVPAFLLASAPRQSVGSEQKCS